MLSSRAKNSDVYSPYIHSVLAKTRCQLQDLSGENDIEATSLVEIKQTQG